MKTKTAKHNGTIPGLGKPRTPGSSKGWFRRLFGYLWSRYRARLIVVMICLLISAASSIASAVFLQYIVDSCIWPALTEGLDAVWGNLLGGIIVMGSIFLLGVLTTFLFSRMMAVITQSFLNDIRKDLFANMQRLPVRFFDTHTHGDIMSVYTNDVDTLRQLISQSLPQLFSTGLTVTLLLIVMLSYSIWLTLVVFLALGLMILVTKKVGGRSARHFVRQQQALGKAEGFIEEMVYGQKVVKVFCHEEAALHDFDEVNDDLFRNAEAANKFANILMPIMGNIGNLLYVCLAFVGAGLVIGGVPNLCLTGINALTAGVVVSFLPMGRNFSMSVSQVSQQINLVVMAGAGAGRIFRLLDEQPEHDEGYVTLVNANIAPDGTVTESAGRTGEWAWRHPHKADGTVTYTAQHGDIVLDHVDFGYNPDHLVLHDITLHALPGQKVALVGATGAGKTTITNLLNRFYDIADGKIRYDGININKIKKPDLRRSLGIVLQDTNLFTDTVMENLRYGRLDATDEECVAAAKLANAHDFITRLPQGYQTLIHPDDLSQGQRQLLSIARAAVADAPVMILDEATSSIDTRTEAIVQQGMDALMKGRTVFVIAHRLSTVRNSDVILVLDHGRVIERGSHDELIAQKGRYYQLYTGAFELE